MTYTSIRGQILGFDETGLLYRKAPISGIPRGFGKDWFVDSVTGAASSSGKSPSDALSTLDAAFAKCTANKGDRIIVLPNHAETITGVGGIAHDVAGVSVIGLGTGNQRPRFLMDGADTVTYAITADDAYVSNLVFASGHADVVAGITTTKKHTWIDDCEFDDNTTDENFLTPIKATGAANTNDGLRVTNCVWISADVGGLEFIEVTDNLDAGVFENNFVVTAGTASPLILVATGKLLTGVRIEGNKLQNKMTANELFFSNDGSTNTGIAINNYCAHRDVTTTHDLGLESSGIDIFNLWSTSTAALQGGVVPAADVNS